MLVSQKSHYALRAVFELAKLDGQGPVKIAMIAKSQEIPQRFLEAILNQLRQADLVVSKRGIDGGYMLGKPAAEITVGQVLGSIQGPVKLAEEKVSAAGQPNVFDHFWQGVQASIGTIYDKTTFQDLLQQDMQMQKDFAVSYSI